MSASWPSYVSRELSLMFYLFITMTYTSLIASLTALAVYVPQFEDIKEGASYNPFLRDRLISGLASKICSC